MALAELPGRLADRAGARELDHLGRADHLAARVQPPDVQVVGVLAAVPELDDDAAGGYRAARAVHLPLLGVDEHPGRRLRLALHGRMTRGRTGDARDHAQDGEADPSHRRSAYR